MRIDRRSFLGAAALTTAVPRVAWAGELSAGQFTHGVASGDPLTNGVMLWTRFVHNSDGRLAYEISEDQNFGRNTRTGGVIASAQNDYCAKIDVRGLEPGRRYFYRFLSASGYSDVGRTLTAPRGATATLSVALFSCANYPFGYFHAYGHAAARDDIDLVIHCGDYIYEYGRGDYPSAEDAVPGRVINPATELIHLDDYYQRYQTYHTDPNLLELRRKKPISVVWDDHEFANDTWREGAQNHQPDTEGLWSVRVAAASKAYFDWMPIRRPTQNGVRIYRSLDWGDLARIVLLDTRLIGRDQQLSYATQLMPRLAQGGNPAAAVADFRATVLDDPKRTMMGAAQEAWFAQTLADSKRRGQPWQIVTQQVVMSDVYAPAGVSSLLAPTTPDYVRQYVTAGEQLGAMHLPFNLDAWSGYPAARTRFLAACAEHANNAVVLGGDSHNFWAAGHGTTGRLSAIEFAGGSVTSPGFEHDLTNAQPGQREHMVLAANPQLTSVDLTNKGYGVLKFKRTECNAEWIGFSDVKQQTAPTPSVLRLNSTASNNAGPSAWSVAT